MSRRNPPMAITAWLRAHDPGYGALRRAGRTALIMPAIFALCDRVIDDPALATFAAFGSFALLLLVDFTGPMRSACSTRPRSALACLALICLGTLVSAHTLAGRVAMLVVAFAILFAAWSARCSPARRRRSCSRSSCRSRCPARPRRSPTGSPAGGSPPPRRCSRSRCSGRRRRATRCACARDRREARARRAASRRGRLLMSAGGEPPRGARGAVAAADAARAALHRTFFATPTGRRV